MPIQDKEGQNDNGRENLREVVEKLKEDKVRQLFSYPRCPKINGYVERFNRTLREKFCRTDIKGQIKLLLICK
jgi:transposase InsO family protein